MRGLFDFLRRKLKNVKPQPVCDCDSHNILSHLIRIEHRLEILLSIEQNLADDLSKIAAGVTAAIADIADLTAQIAALKNQTAPVTQDQLDALTTQADAIVASLGAFVPAA